MTAAATQCNETRAALEAQLTTARAQESQRVAELATAQSTLGAAQLLVTDAQCQMVKIATSLLVWQTNLTDVQQDEQQNLNNKNMKEQADQVLALRQTGPPGWRWQAPANNSTPLTQ